MPRAKLNYKEQQIELDGISFGTLFRLKSFRRHGGGKGSLGVVLAIDKGTKWDNHTRPLIVAFEDCPVARYRLSPTEIEILDGMKR